MILGYIHPIIPQIQFLTDLLHTSYYTILLPTSCLVFLKKNKSESNQCWPYAYAHGSIY